MIVDLENIIRELTPGLIRYCKSRIRNQSLAEEIAQESLVALVQRWKRHGAPDSPQAFVFTVARRRATRAIMSQRMLLPLQLLSGSRDHGPDPEAAALSRSGCAELIRALKHLPTLDREAILMVAVGDVKTIEVARILGISESAVKMRTLRARHRLRALLEDGNARPRK
jgi:RNA polymerase sigma-70 factor (ECF subfamily)